MVRGIINTKLDIALWSQAESTCCFYAQTVVSILKFVNALGKYPGWFKQGNLYSSAYKLSLRKCFERVFFLKSDYSFSLESYLMHLLLALGNQLTSGERNS